MPLDRYVRLMVDMSFRDALWITLSFYVSVLIFGTRDILANPAQLLALVAWLLLFAWVIEVVAIRMKRWEYGSRMPVMLGVGASPLVQLAVTGLVALVLAAAH